MAYRYVTAKIVAVQPKHAGMPVSLEVWGKLAIAGVEVDKENGLYLERHVLGTQRRGGNSWEKAQSAVHNAIISQYEQVRHSEPYNSDHWSVSVVYSREG